MFARVTLALGSVVGVFSFAVGYSVGWAADILWREGKAAPETTAQSSRSEEKPSREKLNQILKPTIDEYNLITKEAEEMVECRANRVENMNAVASELEREQNRLNLDKLIGSSAGVVGAAVCGVGFTYVMTAEVTTVPAFVGAAVLAMGTAVSLCAYILLREDAGKRESRQREKDVRERQG